MILPVISGGMLANRGLPECLIPPYFDVLRVISSDERDLIRIGVEIIQDLRDSVSFSERGADADIEIIVKSIYCMHMWLLISEQDDVDLKCLRLCQCMLERINGVRLSLSLRR